MKKTPIALALILCLAVCAFCFASCGKKNADATASERGTIPAGTAAQQGTAPADVTSPGAASPGTVVPETLVPHVHTPETEYTVDTPETCLHAGSKSYHCAVCGEIVEGTSVPIPADPSKHVVDGWNVVKEATVFEDGAKTGACTVCNRQIEEMIKETYNEYKFTTDSTEKLDKSMNVGSRILGENKHFYPTEENPDGLDLHVEFTFLWNADLLKMSNVGGSANQILTGCINDQDAYVMALTANAQGCDNKIAPGGFEYTATRTVEYGPAGMSEQTANGGSVGSTYADFPNIGGADRANPEYGWHRFALVAHEELLNEAALRADATAKATAAEYRFSFTVYVDGVKLYTLSNRSDDAFEASTYRPENMLFTAESDGEGGIVYSDVSADKNVTWIRIPTFQTTEGTAYAVYADEAIFAGNEFAMNVTKVKNPADNVYTTADGAEIPAKIWFSDADRAPESELGFKVYTYNPADLDSFTYNDDKSMLLLTKTLSDVLNGDHFYPTEQNPGGKDVYFEVAILWNETMANFGNDEFCFCLNYQGGAGSNLFYFTPKDDSNSWCKYAGGFDYGRGKGDAPVIFGPAAGNGQPKENYPNVGEYGWHKIGVRMHQEAKIEDNAVVYSGASFLYVDGELVWKVDLDMTKITTDKNLLFTATVNEGVLVYADNANANKVRVQLRGEKINNSAAPFYFVFGDVSWSAVEPDWEPDIEPVENPEPAFYKLSETLTVPASVYFQAKSN